MLDWDPRLRRVVIMLLVIVALTVLLKQAQVFRLGYLDVTIDLPNARILEARGQAIEAGETNASGDAVPENSHIDYGDKPPAELFVRGITERFDDQSFIHLVMICIAALLVAIACPNQREDNRSVPSTRQIVTSVPWYLLPVLVALVAYLGLIHEQQSDLRGTFLAKTRDSWLWPIQITEGVLHLATAPLAFFAAAFGLLRFESLWEQSEAAVAKAEENKDAGEKSPASNRVVSKAVCRAEARLTALLCAGYTPLMVGIYHQATVRLDPWDLFDDFVAPSVALMTFLVGTAVYAWPYLWLGVKTWLAVLRSDSFRPTGSAPLYIGVLVAPFGVSRQ